MDTASFKTRTELRAKLNPAPAKGTWTIALDMGYSAVKGYSPNFIYCFPSYARKLSKDIISMGKPQSTDILYRDNETGDIYAVGEKANNMISLDETNDSDATLYGRHRYFSEIFKVTSRVGLALGMQSNEYGSPEGKHIRVQTGLPPRYVKDDSDFLREALSGGFNFSIRYGAGDWVDYNFVIEKADVYIIQQPMGSLISVAMDKNGKSTEDAKTLFESKLLVFDPGFRTGDSCLIKGGSILPEDCQTFDDLSMIEVLRNTSEMIHEKYNVSISIPAMQPYLATGIIKTIDRSDRLCPKSKAYPFGDILEEASRKVCDRAVERLNEVYNLLETDYLVITGGTGAAWSDLIRDRLKGLETLTILSGNRNENLPHIFSNVRGYYLYRAAKL